MGEIAEGYFNQVISKCFAIKVASVLAGEKELAWTPEMQALPSYDKAHSRGKIACLNKQTLDFWVKYIPIASKLVGEIPCKAWTREEYKVNRTRYSCLIPKNICDGMNVEDLINSSLVMHGVNNMTGVHTCRTTNILNSDQQICNIEVSESLAKMLEGCGRILSGPVCPLSFKRRSEDEGETSEVTVQSEGDIPTISPDDTILDSMSASGGHDGDSTDVDMLNMSGNTIIPIQGARQVVSHSPWRTNLSQWVLPVKTGRIPVMTHLQVNCNGLYVHYSSPNNFLNICNHLISNGYTHIQ